MKPFVYKGWSLYSISTSLRRGPKIAMFFFSKKKPKSGVPTSIPDNKTISINTTTELAFLIEKSRSRKSTPISKWIHYDPVAFRDFLMSRYPTEAAVFVKIFDEIRSDEECWICAIPDACEIDHTKTMPSENLMWVAGFDVLEYMPEVR